jgi:hypothetical protein
LPVRGNALNPNALDERSELEQGGSPGFAR